MSIHHKDMQVGQVYNLVYTGDNAAYARINGKETVRVLETTPNLVVEKLFDQFGSVFSDEITGGPITYGNPDCALQEVEVTPAPNQEDWFVHAVKVGSIDEALAYGILPTQFSKLHLTGMSSRDGGYLGTYVRVSVEGMTEHPMLQSILCVWPSYAAMERDYKVHGLTHG